MFRAAAAVGGDVEVSEESEEREGEPDDEELPPVREVTLQVHVDHDMHEARPELQLRGERAR